MNKIPDIQFTYENAAERNNVFLLKNHKEPPFIRPVNGWKIAGFGKALWPGSTKEEAVMLEKIIGPDGDHDPFEEGTRIWQHCQLCYLTSE